MVRSGRLRGREGVGGGRGGILLYQKRKKQAVLVAETFS